MTISISQILTSVTEWIRHSCLVRNYFPLLLAWLSTGGFVTFIVCAFAINGIARKVAGIIVAVLSVLLIMTFLQEAGMLPDLPIRFAW